MFTRRVALLGAMLAGLLLLGTIGLVVAEGVGVWYAFRWTLDTVATVGGFRQPRTTAGQIIQIGSIVPGVGTLFYALATVTEFFVAKLAQEYVWRVRAATRCLRVSVLVGGGLRWRRRSGR